MEDKELVGREAEIAELRVLMESDEHLLLITGDAGVGKSQLLEQVSREFTSWRVVAIHGVESETAIALAGLHQVVYPLRDALSELPHDEEASMRSVLTASVQTPSVLSLGVALLELLQVVAAREPLLLIMDDAQWIDEISAQVVAFAARRAQGSRIKFLFGLRRGIRNVLTESGFREMALAPLADAEASRLLDTRFPRLEDADRRAILDQAAGNPLAVVELGKSLDLADGRSRSADLLQDGTIPLSERLERLFGQRVSSLDKASRNELLLGALDGATARAIRGRGRVYDMRNVDGAIEQGLLVVATDGSLAFRHPLVRSAVIQNATPNERRRAHGELAALHRDDILRRAGHLASATLDPDETVAATLDAAADQAVRLGGAATAVGWLTRAAELSEQDTARSRRLADAAFIAGQAGLLNAAQTLLEQDAATGEDLGSVITACYLDLYLRGEVQASHQRVVAAIKRDGRATDDATLRRLFNLLLAIDQFAADAAKWAETDELIQSFEDRLETTSLIYRDAWSDVARRGASVPDRLQVAFNQASTQEPWDGMRLSVAAYYVDHLGDYRPFLDAMIKREEGTGAVTNMMTMLQLAMLDEIGSGQWDSAVETGQRGLELTERHGHQLFAQQFKAFLGVVAAHRGDEEAARQLQREVDRWARPRGVGFLVGFAEAIGVAVALSNGDYETAYAYSSGIAEPGSFPRYSQQAPRGVFDLVEAATHTGRVAEARAHVDAAVALQLEAVSPRLHLLVSASRALVAEETQAESLFQRAVTATGSERFPFEVARVRYAYGMWLRRVRRYANAREQLILAKEDFEALGAEAWARRAASDARAGTPSSSGLSSLTAQERTIAELVAAGLSNKEVGAKLYLSPRTVGAHLYRIFPKLGITSRAAMRDALEGADAAE